jgi:hypothetical protein
MALLTVTVTASNDSIILAPMFFESGAVATPKLRGRGGFADTGLHENHGAKQVIPTRL